MIILQSMVQKHNICIYCIYLLPRHKMKSPMKIKNKSLLYTKLHCLKAWHLTNSLIARTALL